MTEPKATISPQDIYNEISKTVVGQHQAKVDLSLSLYMHYINLLYKEKNCNRAGINNNILLHGPSGNGKTFLVKTAIKAMRDLTGLPIFPLMEVDASTLTSEGWAGTSISDLLDIHIRKVSETALPTTVVYLDEFDKLVNPAVGSGGTDHNKQTMYSLLKFIEGTDYNISSQNTRSAKNVSTEGFLFIFSGNFPYFREYEEGLNKVNIGFGTGAVPKVEELDDFSIMQKIGLVTQMAGRIGKIIRLNRLTEQELEQIIRQNIIPDVVDLLAFMEQTYHVSEDMIKQMVKTAIDRKTGARGLASALNELMKDFLFSTKVPIVNPYEYVPLSEGPLHIPYRSAKIDLTVFTQEMLDDDWMDPNGVEEEPDTENYDAIVTPLKEEEEPKDD